MDREGDEEEKEIITGEGHSSAFSRLRIPNSGPLNHQRSHHERTSYLSLTETDVSSPSPSQTDTTLTSPPTQTDDVIIPPLYPQNTKSSTVPHNILPIDTEPSPTPSIPESSPPSSSSPPPLPSPSPSVEHPFLFPAVHTAVPPPFSVVILPLDGLTNPLFFAKVHHTFEVLANYMMYERIDLPREDPELFRRVLVVAI